MTPHAERWTWHTTTKNFTGVRTGEDGVKRRYEDGVQVPLGESDTGTADQPQPQASSGSVKVSGPEFGESTPERKAKLTKAFAAVKAALSAGGPPAEHAKQAAAKAAQVSESVLGRVSQATGHPVDSHAAIEHAKHLLLSVEDWLLFYANAGHDPVTQATHLMDTKSLIPIAASAASMVVVKVREKLRRRREQQPQTKALHMQPDADAFAKLQPVLAELLAELAEAIGVDAPDDDEVRRLLEANRSDDGGGETVDEPRQKAWTWRETAEVPHVDPVWALVGKAGFTGRTQPDKLGRVYYYVNGKRVAKQQYEGHTGDKAPAEGSKPKGKAPAGKPPKMTVDSTREHIDALKASGKLSGQVATALVERLKGHTVAELNQLKQSLGLKASGTKAVLAQKLVDALTGGSSAPAKAASKPAKAQHTPESLHQHIESLRSGGSPTAEQLQEIAGHLQSLTVAGLHDLRKRMGIAGGSKDKKAQLAQRLVEAVQGGNKAGSKTAAKPSPNKKEARPNTESEWTSHPLARSAVSAVDEKYRDGGGGVRLDQLFDHLKREDSSLTPQEFQKLVVGLHEGGHARMSGWPSPPDEFPRPDLAIHWGAGVDPYKTPTLEERAQHNPKMMGYLNTLSNSYEGAKPLPNSSGPPQSSEPGFTGTDSQGREWRNGELVAAQDEPKKGRARKADAAPASGTLPLPAASGQAKAVLEHLDQNLPRMSNSRFEAALATLRQADPAEVAKVGAEVLRLPGKPGAKDIEKFLVDRRGASHRVAAAGGETVNENLLHRWADEVEDGEKTADEVRQAIQGMPYVPPSAKREGVRYFESELARRGGKQ